MHVPARFFGHGFGSDDDSLYAIERPPHGAGFQKSPLLLKLAKCSRYTAGRPRMVGAALSRIICSRVGMVLSAQQS